MLIILLLLLIFSNALTTVRVQSILYSRTAMKTLIIISLIGFSSYFIPPLKNGIGVFGGLFNATTLTGTFHVFIFLITTVILILTAFYPRKICINSNSNSYSLIENFFKKIEKNIIFNKNFISNRTGEQFRIIEYALIIVFVLCGGVFLISVSDLISIFLSIELQSYGLYILSTLYRDSESSTASGLTYFLLGGLSSCFILLGSGLIYANSGTSNLDSMYIITGISENDNTFYSSLYAYQAYNLNLSLVIIGVGFLFKVSAAPFHFWSPDVYDGLPTIVTTFVAIISKISIFAFLLELVYFTNYEFYGFSWNSIFILSSLMSLIIGSVLGLTQFRIKRLYAYSTISHVGFILLALSINTVESIQSYIFYILQYTISNLNAFIILVTIGYSLYLYVYKNKTDKTGIIDENNSPIQLINQIKGYFYINSFIAISLAITLFSFVGIPPLIGFFAKQMILSAALDSGYVFIAIVAILTSVVGASYYLNLIKQMFFFKNDYKPNFLKKDLTVVGYMFNNKGNKDKINLSSSFQKVNIDITVNPSLSITISTITYLITTFIYTPGEWYNVLNITTLTLFNS